MTLGKIATLTGVLFILATPLAYAGTAGCGFGSMVIEKDTKLGQSIASTFNVSTSSQLFGITSGTSNCETNGIVMREKEAESFAETNMQSLEVEMARGYGENLVAFAQILGCKQSAIRVFGHMTKSHYEEIFPDNFNRAETSGTPDASKFLQSIERVMISNPEVKQGCHQV